MRTSRLSQETSKFFQAMPAATPRSTRATRSSLARFNYQTASTASPTVKSEATDDVSFGSDIEDAITTKSPSSSPAPGTRRVTQKRKRTVTTAAIKNGTRDPVTVKTETAVETKVTPSPSKPRRVRKPARLTKDPETGATSVEPPSDWEEMYALLKHMRLSPGGAATNAAVDTMGCERLGDGPGYSARDKRFHTLTALMLSSQTKDTVNAAAMARLKAEMRPWKEGEPAGLNLENMLAVEPAVLNDMIGKVGFHNLKTKYIKQTAEILRDKFNGDIPPTIEGLTSLPGVGPKMAYLCMSAENGWNRVEGIGVDVHVHRITNLWGWNTTKNPEETRLALQAWLPRDKWREINFLLVGFGQKVCLPIGRKCGDCELGLKGLCRAAERKKVIEGRKRMEAKLEVKEDEGVLIKTEDEIREDVVRDVVVNESVKKEEEDEATPELGSGRKIKRWR